MELVAGSPEAYLGEDDVVTWSGTEVAQLAGELRRAHPDDVAFAAAAFAHVRDEVAHSWDAQDPRVTVTAPEVLREGVGLCFGKAHLLTALLRSQGVPTGLCYQRLTDDEGRTHLLHGLVAAHLRGAWHRQDPRGNKPGVDAQFSLGPEQLAWPVDARLGEVDYPLVLAQPDPGVLAVLRGADDALALCRGGLPSALTTRS